MEKLMRDPDHAEPEIPGGRAAERLRQFLASRYGDDAPAVPPDGDDEPGDDELIDEVEDDERREASPDDRTENGATSDDQATRRPPADSGP
jgi:hypothetical protein